MQPKRRVGPWLKKQRVKRGLTQKQTAKLLDCHQTMVCHYELGRVLWPSDYTWDKIVHNLLPLRSKR